MNVEWGLAKNWLGGREALLAEWAHMWGSYNRKEFSCLKTCTRTSVTLVMHLAVFSYFLPGGVRLYSSSSCERSVLWRVANKQTDYINTYLLISHKLLPWVISSMVSVNLPSEVKGSYPWHERQKTTVSASPDQGFSPALGNETPTLPYMGPLASFHPWMSPFLFSEGWGLGSKTCNAAGTEHMGRAGSRAETAKARIGKPLRKRVKEKGKRKLDQPCVSPFPPIYLIKS